MASGVCLLCTSFLSLLVSISQQSCKDEMSQYTGHLGLCLQPLSFHNQGYVSFSISLSAFKLVIYIFKRQICRGKERIVLVSYHHDVQSDSGSSAVSASLSLPPGQCFPNCSVSSRLVTCERLPIDPRRKPEHLVTLCQVALATFSALTHHPSPYNDSCESPSSSNVANASVPDPESPSAPDCLVTFLISAYKSLS